MKKTPFLILTTITTIILSFIIVTNKPSLTINAETNTNIQLTVTGLVEHPLNLGWNEITAMPKTTTYATIFCVDKPDFVVEQGNWIGIKLRTLLEESGISTNAVKIGFYAKDGYSTDLTVETAMRDDVILAYQKDDQALSDLRLVVPGKWGYKWINQVTNIEVVDYNYLGFWENKGYSDEANIGEEAQNFPQPQPILIPTPSSSSPTSTTTSPIPSATPSPSQSTSMVPGTLQETTPTPESPEAYSLPMETIYATTVLVIVLVAITIMVFRKKKNR